jgi:putative PEP-CTERM system TPR-repeat lipoprotein
MASKDFATAERTLRKALEVRPDYVDAQRRLVALEVQRDRIPQALEIAKTVQKQRPQDAAGYVLEGDVHARKKAWTPAIAAYRAGLKQVDTPDLAIRLHAALRASGQGAEADRLATSRLEKKPQEITFRLYLAESALAARDYKAAMDHYQALVAAQPENATWLNNLAWAAGRQNDPRALEYAEKANGLRPNDPAIMDTLGTLLVEKGDTQQGIALLRKASAAAPDMPALRLNLAKGLIKAGDKEAARRELAELAKLGSKFGGQAEVERLQKSL